MKRYLRTASCGLTLGAGLAVLWLILGSHALFFTACAAILYSVVLPIAMMHSIDTTGVSVLVKRQLVMMGKPDMVSVSLTGTGTRSPLPYDVSLSLPPYLVKKHERHAHLGLMVFFEANRRGEYRVGDTIVTVQDPLGVFSLTRIFSSSQRVTVFPRLLSFPQLRIALTSPLDGQRVRFAPNYDTSQLTGPHPYADDPLNHIHWKVTAHTGALYAKDFSPSRQSRLGMRTGVLSPLSRPRLRANGAPIRASSQSSRQSSTGHPFHDRYFGPVKPLSRIFTMLDALPNPP